MATFSVPGQNLSYSIPDDGQMFKDSSGNNDAVFMRQGNNYVQYSFQTMAQKMAEQAFASVGLKFGERIDAMTGPAYQQAQSKIAQINSILGPLGGNVQAQFNSAGYISPVISGWDLASMGRKMFTEQTGINTSSISGFNMADAMQAIGAMGGKTNPVSDISQLTSYQPKVAGGETIKLTPNSSNPHSAVITSDKQGVISDPVSAGTAPKTPGAGALPFNESTMKNPNAKFNSNQGGKSIDNIIDSAIEAVVASGKTINPNLTPEQLAAIDPATFLQQAEASISPEYKEKFNSIKSELTREFSRLGFDLGVKEAAIDTEEKRTINEGQEELAGRGLAFSGKRQTFESDVATSANEQRVKERNLAFRNAEDMGVKAESYLGSNEYRNAASTLPMIGGRRDLYLGANQNVVGSLNSEKQFNVESMARELEKQERERRAYATRSLSFA